MCKCCNKQDNDFVLLNETASYSNIEIALNRLGMLRVRSYNEDDYNFETQDILNIKFCPMCGRKFTEA